MSSRLLAAGACAALLLTGCLVPERFSARTAFQSDGSYEYSYAGTAVHRLAAGQMAKGSKPGPKEEADMREAAGKQEAAGKHEAPGKQEATGNHAAAASSERGGETRYASYNGNARYNAVVEGKRLRGQALDLLGVLRVHTDPDGVLTLQAGKLDDKDKDSMKTLGIKLDGTLSVTVPISAEVISHNATSTPSFFGLIGTYSWKIGSLEQRPEIKIRFKQ
jgi:hypothetical protein